MKKKLIIIITLMVFIGIIILSLGIYFNSKQYKTEDLNAVMRIIGSSYYEDYYYPTLGLEKIKESKGIVITLDTIMNTSKYQNSDDLKKLDKCDENATYVKVTPKNPYKKNNYKIDVYLECE